jgi:hypothetical protein
MGMASFSFLSFSIFSFFLFLLLFPLGTDLEEVPQPALEGIDQQYYCFKATALCDLTVHAS